jgi:PIN domain nuclease of toxin-antitoxin system
MKLLLDTHTFLWFVNDSPQLATTTKALLESDNDLLLSIASIWEIAIKVSLGKLQLPSPFETFIPEQIAINDLDVLVIKIEYLNLISSLPLYHRDPFDRLLIAQAVSLRECGSIAEDIPIISKDTAFDSYEVKRLW